MSRIVKCVASARASKRTVFVSFITAGDPSTEVTVPALHALVEGGVDILELGVPFSDPEAEGPTIQRSSERALANGVTLLNVLEMVAEFRQRDNETPIVLMGYLNSFLARGVEEFAEQAARAGVDGVIVVNLPAEESESFRESLANHDIDLILLVAPTTPKTRVSTIVRHASGFVYFVSLKGITGADHLSVEQVAEQVAHVRSSTELPVFMGFGIKTPEVAKIAAEISDGIVVGSAIVDTMASQDDDANIPVALKKQALGFSAALSELATSKS